jgi:hypothetical protein
MICKYYEAYLVDLLDVFDIDISLDRYNYFSKNTQIQCTHDTVHIWSSIKINTDKNKYYFSDQEISATLDFSIPDSVVVKGVLKPRKIHHFLNLALQGYTRIDKYYNRFIMKSCIHDIIFIALEKKLKTCILHATAVTNGSKTYLFTGLWWSGKSTMASALSHLHGYTILSDNYAIVSGNTLYPFPELPRITKWTQKLLWIDLHDKADGTKNYLENDVKNIQKEYKIDKIFICSYGDDFSLNKISDPDYLFELLFSINNFTKEFPEYLNLSMLSLLKKFNTNKQRVQSLEEIIENNDFYMLNNNKELQKNINTLLHV